MGSVNRKNLELQEQLFLKIALREAAKKWPDRDDFIENFIVPVFGAGDANRLAKVLFEGKGRNDKARRLKLAEALAMARVLDLSLGHLLFDSETEVSRLLRKSRPSQAGQLQPSSVP